MAAATAGRYSFSMEHPRFLDSGMGHMGVAQRASIRVLLADDHTIVRSGVSQILNDQPDIEVVAQAADGESAVALYRRERPDVSLVDLRMPALDGVHVVEQIRREFPEAVLVVLTTFDTDDDVDRALTAGAKAYLLKDVSPADLVACVRTVHNGGTWVSPAVASKLVARMTRVQLTLREMARFATRRGRQVEPGDRRDAEHQRGHSQDSFDASL